MSDLFENPIGLCGFEFVEFTAPERGIVEPIFEQGPHPLTPEVETINNFFYFQRPTGFFKKVYELVSAGDRVLVRFPGLSGGLFGFSRRQMLGLRDWFSIDRL